MLKSELSAYRLFLHLLSNLIGVTLAYEDLLNISVTSGPIKDLK